MWVTILSRRMVSKTKPCIGCFTTTTQIPTAQIAFNIVNKRIANPKNHQHKQLLQELPFSPKYIIMELVIISQTIWGYSPSQPTKLTPHLRWRSLPYLFIIFLEPLMRWLENGSLGYHFNTSKSTYTTKAYDDDLCVAHRWHPKTYNPK